MLAGNGHLKNLVTTDGLGYVLDAEFDVRMNKGLVLDGFEFLEQFGVGVRKGAGKGDVVLVVGEL